jgi:hypothetical protein
MANEQNAGERLDNILAALTSMSQRMDSLEENDKRRADAEAKDESSYVPPSANDPDDPYRKIDEPRRVAADDDKGTKPMADDLPTKIRKAKAMRDALNALEREVSSEMKETAQGPLHEMEEHAIADCQARADTAYNELGKRAPAPWPGERLTQYRKRILQPLKAHSKTWSDVDLATQSGKNLDVIEKQIYADAIAYADSNDAVRGDEMRVVSKTDESGRRITEFRGRHSFINQFKGIGYRATLRDPREHRLRELLQRERV